MRWSGGQILTGVLVSAIALALGSLVLARDGIPNLIALRQERQRLGEQAVALLQQNASLREQIKRIRTDDGFLESLARRDLGWVRPGETVYRFRRPARAER